MKYFLVDEKQQKYVEYNEENDAVRVFIKGELAKQVEEAKARLTEIPKPPTDAELLEWAKKNYSVMDFSVEQSSLEKTITDNQVVIQEISK